MPTHASARSADVEASAPRALVVGGTGFLGRHVLAGLAEAGWETTVATRRREVRLPGSRVIVLEPRSRFTELFAEIRPALVVNAAGEIWRSERELQEAANISVPERLAMALDESGGTARLVHLGSSMEYGPVAAPAAIDECSATAPRTEYGRSKLIGTQRILASIEDHPLNVAVLRVFNAIGAGMSPSSLLGRTLEKLLRARRDRGSATIELFGPDQHRDYVDARDVADAVLAVATAHLPGDRAPVFNIGSETARTAEEVVRELADVSGIRYRVTRSAAPGDRSAGTDWQLADTGRARALLGWSAKRSLPETAHQIWLSATAEAPTELARGRRSA
ncbi:NAD(P)-dependent oxidoreductase [Saccharopolyspora shandongensis]|uniref:NAD-dependent epimerase/dehydratase family protein n=1 Tax=Saccharopolyspora shandongensis TaxID=418495 RepID=UPI0033C06E76